MEQFAGYGFNKSHSAAYAYLAFVTAYLKAHYPVDFMAALLTSETGNAAKVVKYINECREMGITHSAARRQRQRVELHARWRQADSLRPGRGEEPRPSAPWKPSSRRARRWAASRRIYQFCEKVDLSAINRRMIESLIKAGAMDSLEGTRAQKMAALDGAMESGQRVLARPRKRPGGPVRRAAREASRTPCRCPKCPIGLTRISSPAKKNCSASGSPAIRSTAMRTRSPSWPRTTARPWKACNKGAEVTLCGVLTGITRKRNKEGKPWAAMMLEDRMGSVEALVFATNYERLAPHAGRRSGGLRARPGAAGRERRDQDFGAGHRAAGQCPHRSAFGDFHPRLARPQRRSG